MGPSGPKSETELKTSSRGLPAPGPKKLKTESKKSRKMEISTLFQLFRLFFDSILNFLGPGAGRPRGRKAPGTRFQLHFRLWARIEGSQQYWDPDCLVQPPNSRIPPKSIGEGASGLFGGRPRSCSRARDIFGTPGPSPKKTTCSFSYRFRGSSGISALYQGLRVLKRFDGNKRYTL